MQPNIGKIINTITLEFLRKNDANPDMINFFIRNKLINMPFSLVNEMQGDYEGFIFWIRNYINSNIPWVYNFHKNYCSNRYLPNGTIIYELNSNGDINVYQYNEHGHCTIHNKCVSEYKYDGNSIEHQSYSNADSVKVVESKYDTHGNIVWELFYGVITEYHYEYYHDGQLKSITSIGETLYIPWFEKP